MDKPGKKPRFYWIIGYEDHQGNVGKMKVYEDEIPSTSSVDAYLDKVIIPYLERKGFKVVYKGMPKIS